MSRALGVIGVAVLIGLAPPVRAQDMDRTVQQAFELENSGHLREVIALWREIIRAGQGAQGVQGLERVFTHLGQADSVLPPLDSLLARSPKDRVLHGVQLRVLQTLGRDREVRAAFDAWVRLVPGDATPYREYARQLLDQGRTGAADTVLQDASRALNSTKAFVAEMAQLRAALGRWASAAAAWREAMERDSYLESSAVFSLGPAPPAQRDSIRAILRSSPASAVRLMLALLELQWGTGRDGWRAIADLGDGIRRTGSRVGAADAPMPALDSVYETWRRFAREADQQGAWLAARDALVAMEAIRPSANTAFRAATLSIAGGEPAAALPLLEGIRAHLDSATARVQLLPLEVRALAMLGRAAEAERAVARYGDALDASTRSTYARQIAWAWIREGRPDKARAAVADMGGDEEGEVQGWIALYDGDLAGARKGLRRPSLTTADAVTAMALLGRTHADRSPGIGSAFLALARGDSMRAATGFEHAADELPDAAPLLLALAARIHTARHEDGAAIALWDRVLRQYADAPEAAEGDLEWARMLKRKNDTAGAIEHLEHLILTYPQSALVPQARRELELARKEVLQ